MPLIGWIFLVLALGMILGNLFLLRNSTNKPISGEKLDRIRRREQELEAKEKTDDEPK